VFTEELLGNSAPAGAHWVADRQSGPLLLRFGSEEQRQAILPKITAGECYFSIGMSEPDSGSDLASVRTRAEPVPGGFRVNGTKVWTSGAHRNHYCITLVRTSGQHGDRHKGLSQLLVDLKTPGITIRPIINLAGRHDWNEVTFSDCFIPEECLIGNEGDGWLQVTSELAFERSGPERFMQNFHVLRELVRVLGRQPARRAGAVLGRIVARLRPSHLPAQAGLYHLAPTGETNWHEYASFAIAHALACGMPLKATPATVLPIPAAQYPVAAPRPANSRLDTTRLRATFGLALAPWQDGVREVVAELAAAGAQGNKSGKD